ncbi:MAG: hypothetical protein V9G19_14685 [Tetrasphaera sp.]
MADLFGGPPGQPLEDELARQAGVADARDPALGGLLGALARGRGGPVEHDGDHHDGDAGDRGLPDVERLQGIDDIASQAGTVHERRDGSHRQRGHRALVDADDDRPLGHRQLDMPQQLAARHSQGAGRLDRVPRDRPDAVLGDADQRRERVDEGQDNRCRGTDAEEERDGGEVGEGRHRLHDVEHRGDERRDSRAARHRDADRQPDQARDDDGDEGDDQGVDARAPQAEYAKEQQGDPHHDRGAQSRESIGQPDEHGEDPEPADPVTREDQA